MKKVLKNIKIFREISKKRWRKGLGRYRPLRFFNKIFVPKKRPTKIELFFEKKVLIFFSDEADTKRDRRLRQSSWRKNAKQMSRHRHPAFFARFRLGTVIFGASPTTHYAKISAPRSAELLEVFLCVSRPSLCFCCKIYFIKTPCVRFVFWAGSGPWAGFLARVQRTLNMSVAGYMLF